MLCAAWAPSAAASAEKERADMPEATPVTAAGVRYQRSDVHAHARAATQGLPRNGGYVEAVDAQTAKRRWLLDVVGPQTYDGKEGDKRDVFITELKLAGRHLQVTDERGRHYRIDLHTRAGRPARPSPTATAHAPVWHPTPRRRSARRGTGRCGGGGGGVGGRGRRQRPMPSSAGAWAKPAGSARRWRIARRAWNMSGRVNSRSG